MDSAVDAASKRGSGQLPDGGHVAGGDHVHAGQGDGLIVGVDYNGPNDPASVATSEDCDREAADALDEAVDALDEAADAWDEAANALDEAVDALREVANALDVDHEVRMDCDHVDCGELVDVGPYVHTYLLCNHLVITILLEEHQLQVVGPSSVCVEEL